MIPHNTVSLYHQTPPFDAGPYTRHDLIVTENYYILFDCPIKIDFPAVFTKYIFEKSCLSELICEDTDRRQGLTLVHFSAQAEPFLTLNTSPNRLNTLSTPALNTPSNIL